MDSDIQDYPDDAVDDFYADGDEFAPIDQRWRPVAAIAGIVFVLAMIATVVIVNGGDSASTSATVVVPPSRGVTSPRLSAPPAPSLPRETVTTVTPPPKAPSPSPTAGPTDAPTVIPPPAAVPSVPP
ncbi:MAG: hypothetical protein WAN71_16280, partial [Mycobacterium sp.]